MHVGFSPFRFDVFFTVSDFKHKNIFTDVGNVKMQFLHFSTADNILFYLILPKHNKFNLF